MQRRTEKAAGTASARTPEAARCFDPCVTAACPRRCWHVLLGDAWWYALVCAVRGVRCARRQMRRQMRRQIEQVGTALARPTGYAARGASALSWPLPARA